MTITTSTPPLTAVFLREKGENASTGTAPSDSDSLSACDHYISSSSYSCNSSHNSHSSNSSSCSSIPLTSLTRPTYHEFLRCKVHQQLAKQLQIAADRDPGVLPQLTASSTTKFLSSSISTALSKALSSGKQPFKRTEIMSHESNLSEELRRTALVRAIMEEKHLTHTHSARFGSHRWYPEEEEGVARALAALRHTNRQQGPSAVREWLLEQRELHASRVRAKSGRRGSSSSWDGVMGCLPSHHPLQYESDQEHEHEPMWGLRHTKTLSDEWETRARRALGCDVPQSIHSSSSSRTCIPRVLLQERSHRDRPYPAPFSSRWQQTNPKEQQQQQQQHRRRTPIASFIQDKEQKLPNQERSPQGQEPQQPKPSIADFIRDRVQMDHQRGSQRFTSRTQPQQLRGLGEKRRRRSVHFPLPGRLRGFAGEGRAGDYRDQSSSSSRTHARTPCLLEYFVESATRKALVTLDGTESGDPKPEDSAAATTTTTTPSEEHKDDSSASPSPIVRTVSAASTGGFGLSGLSLSPSSLPCMARSPPAPRSALRKNLLVVPAGSKPPGYARDWKKLQLRLRLRLDLAGHRRAAARAACVATTGDKGVEEEKMIA